MIKKKPTFAVDDTTEMMCAACDNDQMHRIVTVTKQGVVTKAVCESCETVSTFTRGVKTAVSMGTGKNAAPYDRMRKYKKGQEVGIYMQVYNAGIDQTTLRPSVDVEYVLTKNGKELMKQVEDWSGLSDAGQRLTLARLLQTSQLDAGEYELKIKIRDRVSNQALEPTSRFTIE